MGLGFVLLSFCGGCDKPDDVPPRILTESQDYQLPTLWDYGIILEILASMKI